MIFVVAFVQMDVVDPDPNVTLGLGFTMTVDVKSVPLHPDAVGVIVYSTESR
jgi:hypothetical protein